MKHEALWKQVKAVLSVDLIICRLIAAWASFAAITAFSAGDFMQLKFAQDTSMLSMLGLMALFFALYSLVAYFLQPYHSDSWFLMTAATACVLRWLLEYQHKTNGPLFWIAVTVAYALFTVVFLRLNRPLLERVQIGPRMTLGIAVALAVIAGGVIAVMTCMRYKTFCAPNFDFGLFCNMFYNMKETGMPTVSCERDRILSHFAVHISPVYYLLLPFFWIFPSPMTLQIGQAVVLAAGVVPLVLLAQHHKLSGKVTLLVAALYCFYPALSGGCFYDIHENCFLPLFLLLTFLFYEKKRYLPMYLSALGVLSVKEDAAIYLLLFAIFVLLSERNWLHGGALAVLSIGYFCICAALLAERGEGMMVNRFDNLIWDEETGLLGAVKTALVNPGFLLTQLFTTAQGGWEKLVYLLQIMLPLGMLPFCSRKPSRWLLITPLLFNLLTYYIYQYDIGFQYHFGITAFLFYATVKNLPELSAPTRRNLLGIAAAACCCIYVFTVIPKLNTYIGYWQRSSDTYVRMEEILDTVPEDASVSASAFLIAHMADREEIYEVRYHKNATDVDYVVLDVRFEDCEKERAAYARAGYTVYAEHEGLIVILQSPTVSAENAATS